MWGDQDKHIQQIIRELEKNPDLSAKELYAKMSLVINLKETSFHIYVTKARQLSELKKTLKERKKKKDEDKQEQK